jgi:erythromycin esterase-like protein
MDKIDNKTLLTLIAHHLYNAPDDAWGVFERNNLQRLHDLVVDEYHRSLLKKGEDVAGEKSAIYAGIRTTTRENGQITNTIKAGIDEYNDIINTDTRDQYPPALRIQATEATTFLSKLFTRYGTHTVLNPTDDAIIDTGKAYQTGQRSISIADRDKGKLWAHAKHTLTAGTIDGNQARRALACIALADSLGTSHAQHALKQGIKSNPHLYKTFEDELLEYGLI